MPEKSLLDKALEKNVEKTDKAEKACEELMILTEKSIQDTGRVAPNCLKTMSGRNFKKTMMNFQ